MSSSSSDNQKRKIASDGEHNDKKKKQRETIVIYPFDRSASDSKKLAELWHSGTLCDVTIRVANNETFVAHRNVLAIHSDYMRALFSEDRFQDSTKETIELPDMEADVFRVVLEWMYAERCEVDESIFLRVLEAACRFQCADLISILSEKAFRLITPITCLEIWDFAERNYLKGLAAKALHEAALCYESVMDSVPFAALSAERLSAILKSNALEAKEDTVFASVVMWVKAQSEPPTADELGELFEQVRFGLLSHSFLTERVETEELLLGNPRGVLALVRALNDKAHRSPIPVEEFKSGARFRIRDDIRAVRKAFDESSQCSWSSSMEKFIGRKFEFKSAKCSKEKFLGRSAKCWRITLEGEELVIIPDRGCCPNKTYWPVAVFERVVQE